MPLAGIFWLVRNLLLGDYKHGAAEQKFSSPLENAVLAFFNLAKRGAKLPAKTQNNDLRRHFVITSLWW